MTTADANAQAMIAVMAETGFICRPADAVNWRPTKRVSGVIVGINHRLTIVATDGLRGLYLKHDAAVTDYLLGHISHFDGKVEPLFSSAKPKAEPKERKPKVKSKAQIAKDRVTAILNAL